MALSGWVSVSGEYTHNNQLKQFSSDSRPMPKHCDLLFRAHTNVPAPFEVYWQVVNTGEEARLVKQLRGEMMRAKAAGAGGLKHKESTLYSGMHWIECFIVKNGTCEARSGEFIVNIE
jgi:hypothetical protein